MKTNKTSEARLSRLFFCDTGNLLEVCDKNDIEIIGVQTVQCDSFDVRSVLAYDIGGSHISAALCELERLRAPRIASAPLRPDASSIEFLDLLDTLRRDLLRESSPIVGAVLAVPGPFDLAAGVSYMQHKLKSLYGINLKSALAQRLNLPMDKLSFVNDAAAFLLGEVHAGAAQGAKRAVGIVLGTGIGCAFAENGEWVTDGNGVAPGGEIWNLPYRGGTVEDLLSTRAIRCDYAKRTGTDEEVAAIAQRASCDAHAVASFENFGSNLGQVFRDILTPFAPDVVVIGGGISRSSQLFLPSAENQLNGNGFKLVTSSLLDQAALLGAAAFWRKVTTFRAQ
jgi:glucokinase